MPEHEELEMSEEEETHIVEKYKAIHDRLEEIDSMINEKAKGWNTDRMGKVDLTVIRLAVYEMKFDETISRYSAISQSANPRPIRASNSFRETTCRMAHFCARVSARLRRP